eukprot:365590-Chlamydomonas_euryale.AAC.8
MHTPASDKHAPPYERVDCNSTDTAVLLIAFKTRNLCAAEWRLRAGEPSLVRMDVALGRSHTYDDGHECFVEWAPVSLPMLSHSCFQKSRCGCAYTLTPGAHIPFCAFVPSPSCFSFASCLPPPCATQNRHAQHRLSPITSRREVLCIYQLHGAAINSLSVHESFCVTAGDDALLRVWPLDFSDYLLEAAHEGSVTRWVWTHQDGQGEGWELRGEADARARLLGPPAVDSPHRMCDR